MENAILGAAILAVFVIIFLKNGMDMKRFYASKVRKNMEDFGKKPSKKYENNELERIKKLFYRHENEDSIDDITANDLDLDAVFKRMDYTHSAMGADYLYYRLRNPIKDDEVLENIEKKISHFEKDEQSRAAMIARYLKIGSMRDFSFYDCLDYFETIPRKSLIREYVTIVLFLASIGLIFVNAAVGIVGIIAVTVFNIITYYAQRGEIEPYIVSFSYMINFVKQAKDISALDIPVIKEDLDLIKTNCDKLNSFVKGSGVVTSSKVNAVGNGNPLDIFVDYAKMLFHIDIIRFYFMLDSVKKNTETLDTVYLKLGEIESLLSIAFFRSSLNVYAIPKTSNSLSMKDGYHPLIENPVCNSINASRGVLITGSNASGKSTFLKTVALNNIFSRTIHTVLASEYSGPYVHLFSSMSLRDSIESKDSYFMVEIKAIKRMLDYISNNPDERVVIFVDEVLRGTNTVERIAAGCEILRGFSKKNVLCFAATHDGELTLLLENLYDNYHFDEEIKDGDVLFNYMIKDGRATSRNAIELLGVMGYGNEIVSNAKEMAERFIKSGEWR